MIIAVGLDIVAVSRISQVMGNERFLERILTETEREQCKTAEQVAGRWAAKEAAYKCFNGLQSWQEVEIVKNDWGRPEMTVHNSSADPNWTWHVSISHDQGLAAAVVIIESEGPVRQRLASPS